MRPSRARSRISWTSRRGITPPPARPFPVVLGHAGAGVMPRLEVQLILERARLGRIHIALHIAKGHPRAARDPSREGRGLLLEAAVRHHAIDDPQGEGLAGVYQLGSVVELARLGGADGLG